MAQTIPLVTVVDRETGEPITDVSVYRHDRTKYAATDETGRVNLAEVGTDQLIHFRHAAFRPRKLTLREIHALEYVVPLEPRAYSVPEVVVSATRRVQERGDVPQAVLAIPPKQLEFANPQTSADLLASTGAVFVQKSQLGGGSPMIRGFAANRVLIVVDGIRMNNAIYRSGNLQNVIALDANIMEHSEVLYGPGSVMYGSDALGGVMVFSTKEPPRLTEGDFVYSGNAFARYSSANTEKTGHVDLSFGLPRWGFLTGVTYSDFDDLRAGGIRPDDYPDFGKRPWYVEHRASGDVIVDNDDVNIQKPSGYDQINLLQKIHYFGDDWSAAYAVHYSTTGDIPRYDRLIEERDGEPRSAEWYYGPQEWLLNTVTVNKVVRTKAFDELDVTLAHQIMEESRHDRKFGNDQLRHRTEDVQVISLNADLNKQLGDNGRIYYGLEVVHNLVDSEGEGEDIETGEREPVSTRYPDGGTKMTTASVYVQEERRFSPRWLVTGGARYAHHVLHSEFEDTTFFDFPFDEIDINTGALTFSLGSVYQARHDLRFHSSIASGFRAPNLDDAAKVFDSEPGSVIVPNPDLDPEFSYSAELGVEKEFCDRVTVGATGFYSRLADAMVRRDFTFNGQDSVLYDGTLSQVQAIVNAGKAYVTGFDVSVSASINHHWSASTTLTYTAGRDLDEDAPLRHVPPLFGKTSILYENRAWKAEIWSQYNAWKNYGDLSPSEQGKPHLYTEDGTPPWMTFNLRGSYSLTDQTEITAALENILDLHYRPFSSGISAPGRNAVVSLRQSF